MNEFNTLQNKVNAKNYGLVYQEYVVTILSKNTYKLTKFDYNTSPATIVNVFTGSAASIISRLNSM